MSFWKPVISTHVHSLLLRKKRRASSAKIVEDYFRPGEQQKQEDKRSMLEG